VCADGGGVGHDEQVLSRAGDRDVDPPQIGEKAERLIDVAADQRDEHRVFFAALKRVDGVDLDLLEIGQLLADEGGLGAVGRDDRQLGRWQPRGEQGPGAGDDQPAVSRNSRGGTSRSSASTRPATDGWARS
jgi:hypothetical protein